MKESLKYVWLTLKHKWFVLLAGRRFVFPRVSWTRLMLHDLSKFSPSELPHYGRQFFGKADDPQGFVGCWIHHQNFNDHHWEYWIPRSGHSRGGFQDNEPVEMADDAMCEMVADWFGASRAYEGKWPLLGKRGGWPWLDKNFDKLRLHNRTYMKIAEMLLISGTRGQ